MTDNLDIPAVLDRRNYRPVEAIRVGIRHRKELGDVAALAKSIEEVGLLHPIVVTPDGELVAGERRLSAFKLLGRREIPVSIVDLEEIARGEFAENAIRKDFLPSEIESIRRALASKVATPVGRPSKMVESFHHSDAIPNAELWQAEQRRKSGKTRDKIGNFAGVSGRTVEKIAAVVEAAEREPDKYAHLITEMDRTGKVNGAYRKLRMANDEARVRNIVPQPGKYRTLVIDPPWDYEWLSLAGRAAPGYATMTHEQLLAMPVPEWAEDNCHLYLWTTNNFMTRAVDLMAKWGFQHKTVLTWVKPRWGLGSYFRNSTEHVLFGVRGELRTRSDSIATHFEAPMGAHSEKPDKFYEIVRAASYEPFGEAFQRKARDGFSNVYGEMQEGLEPVMAEAS